MKNSRFIITLLAVIVCASCSKNEAPPKEDELPAPVETWKEHWFEHEQLVKRVYYDNSIAIYYDDDVLSTIEWPFTFVKDVWEYSKSVYGAMNGEDGDPRLYAIFHTGKYSGGHPAYYYDESHDYRNVIDCGSSSQDAWETGQGNDLDIVTHEIGHIVESTTFGTQKSPSFPIWKDSKWAEIYIYDVYKGLGMNADAQRWHDLMMNNSDDFPKENTHWFKNWFYPIYSQYGESKVLANYFKILSENFPRDNSGAYTRDLNWGEFIHFWSGAASVDLTDQAKSAFGWNDEWENQLAKAKLDFPEVTY